jgi:hypothetical protein
MSCAAGVIYPLPYTGKILVNGIGIEIGYERPRRPWCCLIAPSVQLEGTEVFY